MTLDLYFARRFLWTFLLMTGAFMVLQILIDLIDEVQDYSAQSFPEVLHLVLLGLPGTIYELLPLIMILSGIALFFRLSRHAEIVAVRAAGQSVLRSVAGVLVTSLLLGVLMVTAINPVVAVSAKARKDLSNLYRGRDPGVLTVTDDGVWLRQGGGRGRDTGAPLGQMVIHADSASADGGELHAVTILEFAPDGGAVRRIDARHARLDRQGWQIRDAKIWPLRDTRNPEAEAVFLPEYTLPTTLTRARIVDSFGKPEFIPVWTLPDFIRQLQRAGFSARTHAMWFHSELAKPVFLLALVVLAGAFCMRHLRITHAGLSTLAAVLIGFGLYYVRNFAMILGESGQIPILAAAWTPPVASLMLAVGLLLHLEDG